MPFGDVVELLLHVGREVGVDDVGEVLDQLVGHHVADVLGSEPSILQADVSAVLDRRDDRRVGGRTPDPELLELLHERSLGVPRRRLREVLLRQDLEHPEELLRREHRQRGLGILVRLVVAPLPVELQEPVEREGLPGGPEPVAGPLAVAGCGGRERLDVDPHLVEPRVGHLGGDGPLPDQGVEPELIAIERRRDTLRRPEHAGGTNRLVGFLRVAGPGLVPARLGQRVMPAVVLLDELRDLAERRVRDRHGVRPHVGDQAGRPLAGQVEPLVEPLGERHGLAGAEPELASGLLLERGGRERRRRRALPLLLLHADDPVGGPAEPLGVLLGVSLGPEEQPLLVGTGGELALGDLGEPCEERLVDVLGGEPDVDAPVLDRNESIDLALPLHDEAHGHRLDATGGQARLDPLPQERRDLVADESIEDPPGLLGVEELHVDRPRVREGLEDGVPGDLGEGHALRTRGLHAQEGRHVERDGLPLTVVVGREDQVLVLLQGPLQVGHVPLRVLGDLVLHRETLIGVDPELGAGQVPDVPIRSPDGIAVTQVLLDRLRLGGRFDDDERFGHLGCFLRCRTVPPAAAAAGMAVTRPPQRAATLGVFPVPLEATPEDACSPCSPTRSSGWSASTDTWPSSP